jgi:hypothetical protein
MTAASAWDRWEELRQSDDPDPIEVLTAIAAFQKYFTAIENEAVKVARAQGRAWQEIGGALGRSRQALWQRSGSPRGDDVVGARWKEIKHAVEDWYEHTAEVRYRTGLPPHE